MRRLLSFGTVLSALAALLLAAPAQAEDQLTSEQLALSVYLAPDPAAVIASLDEGELAMLAARVSSWTAVEVVGEPVKRLPTVQEKSGLGAAAAATSCWSYKRTYKWSDLGVNTGETWMTANWCGNNNGITSVLPDQPGRRRQQRRQLPGPGCLLGQQRRLGGAPGAGLQVQLRLDERQPVHADPRRQDRFDLVPAELQPVLIAATGRMALPEMEGHAAGGVMLRAISTRN